MISKQEEVDLEIYWVFYDLFEPQLKSGIFQRMQLDFYIKELRDLFRSGDLHG